MGCTQSSEAIRPNMFQTKLCMHHKTPWMDVYRNLGELGRGAFGVVEKVEHLKTHKHYAMKTVRFETGSKRHEFEREMNILRVLHHPNIVRMLETFEDEHHFYIVMELSPGGTLLDRVKAREKEFPEDEVKDIMRSLASVIQYLHSRNICHRDLKLENILIDTLDNGGDIKLCDFGASTLYKMGLVCGRSWALSYMAPEVLEGNYKETCDMWSLGVIMYMLLSNKAPFYGDTEDELVESIFAGEVSYAGKEWDAISPEAKALLQRLLHLTYGSFHSGRAFCNYTPFQRAALVAVAFCMSSKRVALHAAVYNELNVAHNGELTLQELYMAPALMRFQLDMERLPLPLRCCGLPRDDPEGRRRQGWQDHLRRFRQDDEAARQSQCAGANTGDPGTKEEALQKIETLRNDLAKEPIADPVAPETVEVQLPETTA
ncbi:CAMK/CDPK protein kinase [Phytophthora cinnamomi]|uniref:CAMK/CDPK protein kinase n=1 Tax=Phytophthora cinnamomi TaxID=4785 RepID=UPI003559EEB8|nr:CAMK/CDPK protein kinase [Phytophthora cinnamomi]